MELLDDDLMVETVPLEATIPPFDLENPQAEEAYGSVKQNVIAQAMVGTTTAPSNREVEQYHSKRTQSLKLSVLKRLYDDGEGERAFALLKKKWRLDVDQSFYKDGTSTHFTYQMAGHHIDFSLKVPDRIGFDVILPPESIGVNTTWCFHLALSGAVRGFLNQRGDLGFDPTGRMLHIGTHDHDNIFLAMAPKRFLDQDEILTPGTPSGATQMTQPHVRMATCILLWAMGRIAHTDYSTRPNAYVALQGTLDQYRSVTDWVYVLVFHVILNLSGKILNPYPLLGQENQEKQC